MNKTKIDTARNKLVETTVKGHNDLSKVTQTATTIERQAAMMQRKLTRRLSQLAQQARQELESGDRNAPDYSSKQRAYLTAIRNLNRAEKQYQLARRQRVMAERMQ